MRGAMGIMPEHGEGLGPLYSRLGQIFGGLGLGLSVTARKSSHEDRRLSWRSNQKLPHVFANIANFFPRIRAEINSLSPTQPGHIPCQQGGAL